MYFSAYLPSPSNRRSRTFPMNGKLLDFSSIVHTYLHTLLLIGNRQWNYGWMSNWKHYRDGTVKMGSFWESKFYVRFCQSTKGIQKLPSLESESGIFWFSFIFSSLYHWATAKILFGEKHFSITNQSMSWKVHTLFRTALSIKLGKHVFDHFSLRRHFGWLQFSV
jgi:hypothetical protein